MKHICPRLGCNTLVNGNRVYCSPSCKQLAYLSRKAKKRKEGVKKPPKNTILEEDDCLYFRKPNYCKLTNENDCNISRFRQNECSLRNGNAKIQVIENE